MASHSVQNRVRVGGSGFTVFAWQGQLLGFANQVAHTSPAPVGPGATPIQPMDAKHPLEIITPEAAGPGTLTLEFIELYGAQVWARLAGLEENAPQYGIQTIDIVGIFARQAALKDPITVVKYIRPPILRGSRMAPYTEEYHNSVITNVTDGETISIGTMEILKQLTIMYTQITRGGVSSTGTTYPGNESAPSATFAPYIGAGGPGQFGAAFPPGTTFVTGAS